MGENRDVTKVYVLGWTRRKCMEAREYFFRLSYQQYQKGGREERVRWELEVIHSVHMTQRYASAIIWIFWQKRVQNLG